MTEPSSLTATRESTPTPGRRPVFLVLVGIVIVAAIGVRLVMLGRQSYWIDELFSVNQADGRFASLLRIGSTEVHTPFYAGLLWVWMKIGSTQEVWTRLLSTLIAVIAVPVAYRGLGAVRLGEQIRWALAVAVAAGGTAIVYAVETRSYALLLLGSVGLTAVTLRAALLTLSGDDVPRRIHLIWVGWVGLAATAHLFGAVLTAGAVIVLAACTLARAGLSPGGPARRVLAWVVLAAAGCSLQLAWLVRGLSQPEFAAGTDWIQAPNSRDVWELATTTFSSGNLTTRTDGFAWTSPIGLLSVVTLALVAAGFGYRARRQAATDTAAVTTREAEAAVVLLALAVIVIGLVYAVSQWLHLWTLRNMVIVTPALTWGVICLVAAAAGTEAGRRTVATVSVALLGLSLLPITVGLADPYKTDFRGTLAYLASVQAEQPKARFVFLGSDSPVDWRVASDRPDDPALAAVYQQAVRYPRLKAYLKARQRDVSRASRTEVVVYYPSVTHLRLEEQASNILAHLNQSSCRRIPTYGLVVVRCR
jgi:hypothetical protein